MHSISRFILCSFFSVIEMKILYLLKSSSWRVALARRTEKLDEFSVNRNELERAVDELDWKIILREISKREKSLSSINRGN